MMTPEQFELKLEALISRSQEYANSIAPYVTDGTGNTGFTFDVFEIDCDTDIKIC